MRQRHHAAPKVQTLLLAMYVLAVDCYNRLSSIAETALLCNHARINNVLHRRRYHRRDRSPRRRSSSFLSFASRGGGERGGGGRRYDRINYTVGYGYHSERMGPRESLKDERSGHARFIVPYRRDNRYLFIIAATVVGARFIGARVPATQISIKFVDRPGNRLVLRVHTSAALSGCDQFSMTRARPTRECE